MLRTRLLTAAIGIPILIWLIFAAPFGVYRGIILFFTLIGLIEYFQMAFPDDVRFQGVGVAAGGLAAISMASASPGYEAIALASMTLSAVLMSVVIGGLIASLFVPHEPERAIARLGSIVIGILYAGACLPHFIWLRAIGETGPAWVLFVLAISFGGDSGAYFAGRSFGRAPLMPQVSPKKTIEGSLGGVAATLVVGVLARVLFFPEISWTEILFLAFVSGVLAQVGDLSESLLKRAFGAKDSGWLIPGHGGLLDRTDSLVFPAVFIYYYVSFLRPTG